MHINHEEETFRRTRLTNCGWAESGPIVLLQMGIQESIQYTGSECGGHWHREQERDSEQHVQQGSEDVSAQAQILSHGHHVTPAQWLYCSPVAGVILSLTSSLVEALIGLASWNICSGAMKDYLHLVEQSFKAQ